MEADPAASSAVAPPTVVAPWKDCVAVREEASVVERD